MQTSRRSLLRALAALPAVAALATAFRPDRAAASPPALVRGLFDPATPGARLFDSFRLIPQERRVELLPRFVGADYGLSEPTFSVVEVDMSADGIARYRLVWTYRFGGAPDEVAPSQKPENWRIEQLNGEVWTGRVLSAERQYEPTGIKTTYVVEGR